MTFSVTKSYLSTIAGIAYDIGLIKLNDEVYKYITYDYEKIKYIINYNFLQSFNSIEATDKELYKNIKMHLDSFYLNKLDGMNIKESQRRMKFIYRTRYG